MACFCLNRKDQGDDEERDHDDGEAVQTVSFQHKNATALTLALLAGVALVIVGLTVEGAVPAQQAHYITMAGAFVGGLPAGLLVNNLLQSLSSLLGLPASAKSAVKTANGPLTALFFTACIRAVVEVLFVGSLAPSEVVPWRSWTTYCFMLAGMWWVRRIVSRAIQHSMVKKVVGEKLARMMFLNEAVQRLTDAYAGQRDAKAQDKAFKTAGAVLKEATFEEKAKWAHSSFLTAYAPRSTFHAANSTEAASLASQPVDNAVMPVKTASTLVAVARATFARMVGQGKTAQESASAPQMSRVDSRGSAGKSKRQLVPTGSFVAPGTSSSVAPVSQLPNTTATLMAQADNGPDVNTQHMMEQVGPKWAGPLMARMDTSENNSLTEDEFVDGMLRLYHDYYDTKRAALGDSPIAGAFGVVMNCVIVLVAIAGLQFIVGIQLTDFIVTFAAIGLGLSFAVGSSIAACVRAFQLVTIIAPYAVGDKVQIEGWNDTGVMDVARIDMLVTEFRDFNTGVPIIVPNSEILSAAIRNLLRSNLVKAVIVFRFKVNPNMTAADLGQLKAWLERYCKDRPMDWESKVRARVKPSEDGMKIKIKLHHHRSLRASQARNARSDIFLAINDKMRSMNLLFTEAPKPVVLVAPDSLKWPGQAALPPSQVGQQSPASGTQGEEVFPFEPQDLTTSRTRLSPIGHREA